MKKQTNVSKDYVFTKNAAGKLMFVGRFDDFYQNEKDPWGQKGKDKRLKEYYRFSRQNLLKAIKDLPLNGRGHILEVGCGLGYVSSFLSQKLGLHYQVTGADISPTAVAEAKKSFKKIPFSVMDITKPLKMSKQYNVVIMSQILWYILERLPQTFCNLSGLIKKDGHLIFVNAFLHEQRYGKEIIDGFDGLLRHVLVKHKNEYRLVNARIDYSKKFIHDDGIAVFQKR
jgi:SAM-dependent methyltransferase